MPHLLAISAVSIATAASLVLIWFLDRFEKSPIWLLTLVFLWGAVPAGLIAYVVNSTFMFFLETLFPADVAFAVTASLGAPVVEETTKGFALLVVFLVLRHHFADVLTGIVFGAIIGVGFAWQEDIAYVAGAFAHGGVEGMTQTFVGRVLVFGFGHAFLTSLTGLGFGLAREVRSCWLGGVAVIGFLLLAMAAHFLHNALCFFGGEGFLIQLLLHWGGLFVLLIIVVAAWIVEWKWVNRELREEVALGTIGERDYRQVSKWFGRLGWELRFLAAMDFGGAFRIRKMFNLLVKLAFLKRRYRRRPDENTWRRIEETRARVALLRRKFA